MAKTIEEINEKIKSGKAVVFTAEEIIDYAKEKGIKQAAKDVDVVTTGTFGAMCSSSIYLNIGHSSPRIKLGGGRTYLNDVPAYTGIAAVDLILGATAIPDDDPRNRTHPGEFNYGGGHVIEELVAGKDVRLTATAHGTDCYPRRKLDTWLNLKDVNEAVLYNYRNAYQNYNVATNLTDRTIYTYMGMLKPRMGNITYATSGQLSPLFNDPYYKTIGLGTRIFLGGGIGYVSWQGTQHSPSTPRNEKGIPIRGAGTLALIGDLKQMKPRWLVGTSMLGYGATLSVGVGIPIPILDEEMLEYTTITDDDIPAAIIDYGGAYPQLKPDVVAEVTYGELRSGQVKVNNKKVPTASLSSYSRALEIANTLKEWIQKGDFELTSPVAPLPGADSGLNAKALNERPVENEKS
ncbi:MAG: homocysteine biosynthesis protein [Dehalococcoidales bacterium]|nr:homocysteine biosynthesis protein [Dehalococcoidales bacterium]